MAALRLMPKQNDTKPLTRTEPKTPKQIAGALLRTHNKNENDATYRSGWTGATFKTGTVFGKEETENLLKELEGMPKKQQASVLKALSAELKKTDMGMTKPEEFNKNVYLNADASKLLNDFAAALKVKADFAPSHPPVVMG